MEITLNRHIEATPDVRNGKPRISGTRITVSDIAICYLRMGHSLDWIAGKYQLSLASVHAAMAHYYDHRDEIEQAIQDDEAFANGLKARYPSRLAAKLKEIRGE